MARKATGDVSVDALHLVSQRIQLDVSLAGGTLAVGDPSSGWLPFPRAHTEVELEDGRLLTSTDLRWEVERGPERFRDSHGGGVRALLRSAPSGGPRLRLELCVYDAQPFALLRVGIENAGRRTGGVRRLTPLTTSRAAGGGLTLGSAVGDWRFFRHGWQSWTPSLSLSTAQRDIDARPPVHAPAPVPEGRGVFASEEVAALLDPATGRTLVVGFVSAHRCWTQVRLDGTRRAIEASSFADGVAVAPSETFWSERLLIELAGDTNEALERYADALAREMGARVPRTSPTGWCSWYYYFKQVTEDDILKNLRFLEQHRDALPFEYVQIDDGYQANIGDWTQTNEKFPHGMAWLAHEIRDAGFRPGIWLAPLFVGATSKLYTQHPDWVVRDDQGAPVVAMRNWGQECHGLDCTYPKAEAWLRDLFREITDGWGYDYVKIDFLFGAAVAGRRHDRNATRIDAYRRGLRAIREAVGERFVLGCGALVGASVGLVDGQRIGPDVAPWWRFNRPLDPPRERGRPAAGGEPSTEASLRNIITRSWMHGRLWANDPDCLIARTDRTKLTLSEVQSLATAIALSGGMVLLSDDMMRLPPDRLDLVSLLLPPLGDAPAVPGLLTDLMPSLLELGVSRPFESWRLLGCFNWQRRRRALSAALPPGRWHAFELWERRYLGAHERQLDLPDVPAHGARLIALRPAVAHPQLLATTFHFSMGGREIAGTSYNARYRELRIDLRPVAKRHGEVFVHAPRGHRLLEALLDGEAIAPSGRQGRVLAFDFTLRKRRSLALQFK